MEFFSELNLWHWLIIGLVLFGIEMMVGTFDLLWIAVAAWATALFTAIAPDAVAGWQMQCAVFGVASVILVVLGRTVFNGLRKTVEEHPTLNKRMTSLIGARAVVTGPFSGGSGQVRMGDTVWRAEALDGSNFVEGDAVIVDSAKSSTVIVRAI